MYRAADSVYAAAAIRLKQYANVEKGYGVKRGNPVEYVTSLERIDATEEHVALRQAICDFSLQHRTHMHLDGTPSAEVGNARSEYVDLKPLAFCIREGGFDYPIQILVLHPIWIDQDKVPNAEAA